MAQRRDYKDQMKEGYEQQLSGLTMDQDVEQMYKPQFDRLQALNSQMSTAGGLNAIEKKEYDELRNWYSSILNQKQQLLLKGAIAGNPYEAGTFPNTITK